MDAGDSMATMLESCTASSSSMWPTAASSLFRSDFISACKRLQSTSMSGGKDDDDNMVVRQRSRILGLGTTRKDVDLRDNAAAATIQCE